MTPGDNPAPHKCPQCGCPAYHGFTDLQCTWRGCEHYHAATDAAWHAYKPPIVITLKDDPEWRKATDTWVEHARDSGLDAWAAVLGTPARKLGESDDDFRQRIADHYRLPPAPTNPVIKVGKPDPAELIRETVDGLDIGTVVRIDKVTTHGGTRITFEVVLKEPVPKTRWPTPIWSFSNIPHLHRAAWTGKL